jgi:type IV pilus assembly protein PilE
MRAQKGFTLIEVMIVVGIVAILSAIAIPNYSEYVRRARITEATSTLGTMRLKMEQYFQDNRTYAGACTNGTVAVLPTAPNFIFACPVRNLTSYQITATGNVGSVTNFVYQMDMDNPVVGTGLVRSATFPPASGWINSPNCWAIKKDGSC